MTHHYEFGHSENVYESLVEILRKLRTSSYENLQLQEDFQLYGEESFRFVPIRYGRQFMDEESRLVEFKRTLKKYKH